MSKELVTEFVFLGNESAHSESMLHNIPFGSKVGCIYLHFYKIQTTYLLRKNVKAFYPDYALKHSNRYELNMLYTHLYAKYTSSNFKNIAIWEKAKKELKGERHWS